MSELANKWMHLTSARREWTPLAADPCVRQILAAMTRSWGEESRLAP